MKSLSIKSHHPVQRSRLSTLNLCALTTSLGCLVASLAGCVEGRLSTHELEHVVPAHWPATPVDAADKIEARLNASEASASDREQARIELGEIVSWLPEVAADSAMPEAEWCAVYAACQRIETLMTQTQDFQPVTSELHKLCSTLRQLRDYSSESD